MSRDESRIYRAIIEEQIALQELQAALSKLERSETVDAELLTAARQIKHQRARLSQLWEQASAIAHAEEFSR
jgi:hypothetical protein